MRRARCQARPYRDSESGPRTSLGTGVHRVPRRTSQGDRARSPPEVADRARFEIILSAILELPRLTSPSCVCPGATCGRCRSAQVELAPLVIGWRQGDVWRPQLDNLTRAHSRVVHAAEEADELRTIETTSRTLIRGCLSPLLSHRREQSVGLPPVHQRSRVNGFGGLRRRPAQSRKRVGIEIALLDGVSEGVEEDRTLSVEGVRRRWGPILLACEGIERRPQLSRFVQSETGSVFFSSQDTAEAKPVGGSLVRRSAELNDQPYRARLIVNGLGRPWSAWSNATVTVARASAIDARDLGAALPHFMSTYAQACSYQLRFGQRSTDHFCPVGLVLGESFARPVTRHQDPPATVTQVLEPSDRALASNRG